MNTPNLALGKKLSRRSILRGAGVSMALPWLDAMSPAFARSADSPSPRRFVSVSFALGFHGPNLFPEEAGRNYTPSLYLEHINDLINDLTVFSGVSLPGVRAGRRVSRRLRLARPKTAARPTPRTAR